MVPVEPNHVLHQVDETTGIVKEYHLEPTMNATLVTIRTCYQTSVSLGGLLESVFAPALIHKLFQEELTKLCRYAVVAPD
jgi:hypothetical protein